MKTTTQSGGRAVSEAGVSLDQRTTQNLSAALDQLWVKFLPETLARVELLEAASVACGANELSATQREAGHAAAHKLAGSLGTFNLARGSELAREFEVLSGKKDAPESSVGERLAVIAAELRTIVEGRK